MTNKKFLVFVALLSTSVVSCTGYYRTIISTSPPSVATTRDSVARFLSVTDRVSSQHGYEQVKSPDILGLNNTVTYLRSYRKKGFEFPINVDVSISIYLQPDRSTIEVVVGGGHDYREMQEIAKSITEAISRDLRGFMFTVKVVSTNSFA